MKLADLRQPSDLRALTYPQLDELAGEIRDFIVQAVELIAQFIGVDHGAVLDDDAHVDSSL